jgi:hypothetical protein
LGLMDNFHLLQHQMMRDHKYLRALCHLHR